MSLMQTMRKGRSLALAATGRLARSERAMAQGLTILTHHRVLEDEVWARYPARWLAMPLSAFRELVALVSKRFTTMTVHEALQSLSDGKPDKPIVCFSFDDGYEECAGLIKETLEEHNVRGTFFVTTGLVESPRMFWFDAAIHAWQSAGQTWCQTRLKELGLKGSPVTLLQWLQDLKEQPTEQVDRILDPIHAQATEADRRAYGTMTRQQIKQLADDGHEIGSHSVTHPIFTHLDEAELDLEVGRSREFLREVTGAEIPGFCYPNGSYDSNVVARTKSAGYEYACTVESGRNPAGSDPMRLRRVELNSLRVTHSNGRLDRLTARVAISLARKPRATPFGVV